MRPAAVSYLKEPKGPIGTKEIAFPGPFVAEVPRGYLLGQLKHEHKTLNVTILKSWLILEMKLIFREYIKLILLYDSKQQSTWLNIEGISGYLVILYLLSALFMFAALNALAVAYNITYDVV
jgi:hypothetical protein